MQDYRHDQVGQFANPSPALLLFCYGAFEHWHLTSKISDRILEKISDAGLFTAFNKTKLIALSFLVISLVGVRGKKTEKLSFRQGMAQVLIGLLIYFLSSVFLKIDVAATIRSICIYYYRTLE